MATGVVIQLPPREDYTDRKGTPLTWRDQTLYNTAGRVVCGARVKRQPENIRCASILVLENGRCKAHGGSTPRGVDHPMHRGRGWTKDIPARLAEKFQAALEDPDILALNNELALLDVRIGDVLGKLDLQESESAWSRLQVAWSALRAELRFPSPDQDVVAEKAELIDRIVQDHQTEAEVWKEVRSLIHDRRMVTETERKRMEFLEANVSAKQMAAFLGATKLAILEEVSDPEERMKLAIRLQNLLNKPS